jgi:putative ABC transport system substrate-binding protein
MNIRRKLVVALGAGVLAAPFASFAQTKGKVPRIGVLSPGSAAGIGAMTEAMRAGLRELGYVEGKNIVIEYRWAENKYERLPALAADLVRLKVDVLVTHATSGVDAARRATTTIPIVMAAIGDPVASGFISDLAHPGGNITGLSFFSHEIGAKRLELLKELLPGGTRFAVLWDRSVVQRSQIAVKAAARDLKMPVEYIEAQSPDKLESTIANIARNHVGGLVVWETPMTVSNGKTIGALATKQRLAAIGFKEVAEGGGLIAYGANLTEMWRRSATFIDKILKGAKPGDLPIEQASKFDLVINMQAAKALGIKIPNSILVRAGKVIE